jgi:hypothetical protein
LVRQQGDNGIGRLNVMNAASVKLLIQVVSAAVLLAFIFMLQTQRISRIWLRWLPRTLRATISPSFDPPPIIHPGVPDPNEIELDKDASPREKIAAAGFRILFSAAQGFHDFEHYLLRFFIAFIAAVIVMFALIAVAAGIAKL